MSAKVETKSGYERKVSVQAETESGLRRKPERSLDNLKFASANVQHARQIGSGST